MKLFCTFVVFCCNVPLLGSLSLLSADALMFFLSVLLGSVDLLGCHGAVSLITLLRCFAGFHWVLTALCWARSCSFTGVLSVFFMHNSQYRFVGAGFFQFSRSCTSFGSVSFSWVLLSPSKAAKGISTLSLIFRPQITPFSPVFVSSSCRHNILSVLSAKGGQH